jgi:hypothetical protein
MRRKGSFPLFLDSSSIRLLVASSEVVIKNAYQNITSTPRSGKTHKAQMDEALMLDGEPLAQQKHWISQKIGDKVVPKLQICIHTIQSLMQGQRLQ